MPRLHKAWRVGGLLLWICALTCTTVLAEEFRERYGINQLCPGLYEDVLRPTIDPCSSQTVLHSSPEPVTVSVLVPKEGLPTGATFVLKSLTGNADLTIASPDGAIVRSSSKVTGEDVVGLSAAELSGDPGNWTLTIRNADVNSAWTLTVITQRPSVRLNSSDRAALASLARCCPDFSPTLPACQALAKWTSAPLRGREPPLETDLCQDPNNVCDTHGHIQVLSLPGTSTASATQPNPSPPAAEAADTAATAAAPAATAAGPAAAGPSGTAADTWPAALAAFAKCPRPPAGLAQLQHLRVLDLSDNGISWGWRDVAGVLARMRSLTHVYLDRNFVTGVMTCDLFQAPAKLNTLSLANGVLLSHNGAPPVLQGGNQIRGRLPQCVFTSLTLKVLDLRGNSITGGLPPVPPTSPLLHLDLSRQGAMEGAPTLVGRLPRGMVSSARHLRYMDLSYNGLEGPIPDLPGSLMHLDLAANALTGSLPRGLPELPALKVLHLANNKLNGTISPALGQLPLLTKVWLSDNLVEGSIDFNWSTPHLEVLRISGTKVQGAIPASLARLPRLRVLSLVRNPGLTTQADFAAALQPSGSHITWYNVSGCGLEDLPEGLRHLGVFTSSRRVVDQDMQTDSYCFDVSSNNIHAPLPLWLLGPYPNDEAAPPPELHLHWQHPLDQDRNRISCMEEGVTAVVAVSGMAKFGGRDGAVCVGKEHTLVSVSRALQQLVDNRKLERDPAAGPEGSAPGEALSTQRTPATPPSGQMHLGDLTMHQLSALLGAIAAAFIAAVSAFYIHRLLRRRGVAVESVGGGAKPLGPGGHPVAQVQGQAAPALSVGVPRENRYGELVVGRAEVTGSPVREGGVQA